MPDAGRLRDLGLSIKVEQLFYEIVVGHNPFVMMVLN
jgi:hypothetical protein